MTTESDRQEKRDRMGNDSFDGARGEGVQDETRWRAGLIPQRRTTTRAKGSARSRRARIEVVPACILISDDEERRLRQ